MTVTSQCKITLIHRCYQKVLRFNTLSFQRTVFGLSADVVTILSITGAISNALKLILAWESFLTNSLPLP